RCEIFFEGELAAARRHAGPVASLGAPHRRAASARRDDRHHGAAAAAHAPIVESHRLRRRPLRPHRRGAGGIGRPVGWGWQRPRLGQATEWLLIVARDEVFKALADASRRTLLDRLRAHNGQTLSELCARLDMTRQAVSKHLAILERANLVATARRGREKLHYLNPVPINEIAERWIGKYERIRLSALAELKRGLEAQNE